MFVFTTIEVLGSKQFELLMKTNYIHEYTSPKLEVIEVEIEQGFSISNGGFNPGVGGWDDGDDESGSAE